MSLDRPELAVRTGLGRAMEDSWQSLGSPGTRWTGSERIRIVAEARAARLATSPGQEDDVMARAAWKVAASPASIRRHWVDALARDGLDPGRYVELVGIVSRAVAIDTVLEALGLEIEPLPQPVAGDPSEDVDQRAGKVKAWVPMVGGASITQALSMVPAENAKLEALHGALYLSFEEMADPKPGKELTRPQMELVAARTSAYNECFY